MKNTFKKSGISNQKIAIFKKAFLSEKMDMPHILERFKEKMEQCREQYSGLDKPHTLEEIKKITGYKGSDKNFRAIIKAYFSEVSVTRPPKKRGRPRGGKYPKRGRVKKRYIVDYDKIIDEWASEYAEALGKIRLKLTDATDIMALISKPIIKGYETHLKTLSRDEFNAEVELIKEIAPGFPPTQEKFARIEQLMKSSPLFSQWMKLLK